MRETRAREIGGEFSLPSEYLCERATNQIAKYSQYRQKIFLSSGRGTLRLVAKVLRLDKDDEVLLPSYLCKEIVKPFREEGVQVKFYKVSETLNVDIDDIKSKIGPNTKTLLFIHYFGFPQTSTKKIRSLCKDNNVFLIEDLVQSFLTTCRGRVLGSTGDVAFSSYRKWIPIPDGALLGINNESFRAPPIKKESQASSIYVKYRIMGLRLKGRYLRDQTIPKRTFRKIFAAADKLQDSTPIKISDYSKRMLSRFDFNAIIKRRRDNFRHLLNNLKRIELVTPLYKKLPRGVCPLGFPTLVENRDRTKKMLIKNRIYPPIHWKLPREVKSPVSRRISDHILTLPIDQRYGAGDMDFISETLGEIEASS